MIARTPATDALDMAMLEQIAWPAVVFLVADVAAGAPDVADHTRVPPELGLPVADENQVADVFQRAILADVLINCAAWIGDQATRLANAELDYLISCRQPEGRGWSYLPGFPAFPPDADSLSAVTLALHNADRQADVERFCLPAMEFAVRDCAMAPGVVPTWLVPRSERTAQGGLPQPWAACLFDEPAVDVLASFLLGLHRCAPERFATWIRDGLDYLESTQRDDGGWISPFYCGRYYVLYVVLRVLGALRPESPAVANAVGLLRSVQQADGGWGRRSVGSDALSTAVALLGLAAVPEALTADDIDMVDRAVGWLAATREADQMWPAAPLFWRLEEAGRPPAMLPYGTRVITGAYVLNAVLAWLRLGRDERGQLP